MNDYICPQCQAEYPEPGLCETCQVDLVARDEYEDEYNKEEEGLGTEYQDEKVGDDDDDDEEDEEEDDDDDDDDEEEEKESAEEEDEEESGKRYRGLSDDDDDEEKNY